MRAQYPPEFRQQMVELVRAGRSPKALAREFEPSEQTIRNWVKQFYNRRRRHSTLGYLSPVMFELRHAA